MSFTAARYGTLIAACASSIVDAGLQASEHVDPVGERSASLGLSNQSSVIGTNTSARLPTVVPSKARRGHADDLECLPLATSVVPSTPDLRRARSSSSHS